MPAVPPVSLRALDASDASQALAPYTELTVGPDCTDENAFFHVLADPGTTVMGAFHAGRLVGMVTVHVLPSVTWQARPYARIENVVTASDHRKKCHAPHGHPAQRGSYRAGPLSGKGA